MDIPIDQVVTLADAAERLGKSAPYLRRESNRPEFPAPIGEVSRARVWDFREIQAWFDARPGKGNRTPR